MALLPWLSSVFVLASPILLLALILVRNHAPKKRHANLPPGPPPLPVVGNLHLLGSAPHLSLGRLARKYGPVVHLTLGQVPTVVVSSARAAREVLRTHDLPLSSRPQLYAAKHLFYGCTDVVFAPYGPYWRHVRKICILELLSARRVESYRPARAEEVGRLVGRVAAAAAAGGAVNLSRLLGLYANGVLCRAALGREFAEGGEYDRHGFQEMLDEYQALLGGFSLGDFYPSLEWVNAVTGMKRRLERTFERFDRFFDEIIEEHRERTREEDKDLLDVLLDVQKDGSFDMPLTMDNIKAIILDMFAAGTDTTFITLDWSMTELVMNPRALKRAQEEVRSIVGEGRMVSESDLPQLRYLNAVIKEVFRVHPPVPLLVPRESMEQVSIDGYQIPAKTRIFINAWAIGRDPESWENPEAFEPERFLDSSIDFKGQDFELLPFGSGRRGCPGIAFGMAGIEIALAQLLHSFDWELPHGTKPQDLDMKEAFGISVHRIAELIVVARPHYVIQETSA